MICKLKKEDDVLDEKALVKASQNGDKQAFEELIRMFYQYVYSFLLKTTNDEMLSQDLTQETFLKMIRSIEKYDIRKNSGFGTWLITIARNCYIDTLRKNRALFCDIDEIQLDDENDMQDQVINKIRAEKALTVIDTLPEEQGLAMRLKYQQNMSLSEISEYFGVPEKTIKSRIHEGTVKVRKIMEEQEGM